MDVNTLYRVTGQRGEQIAANDEKRQMKTSQELCAFSANTGLRVAKGRDLAQSSGKKHSKCKRTDYQYIYRNDRCRSTAVTQQKRLSIWDFDFSLIFSERLCRHNYGLSGDRKCCSSNHSGHREGSGGRTGARRRLFEYLVVCNQEETCA